MSLAYFIYRLREKMQAKHNSYSKTSSKILHSKPLVSHYHNYYAHQPPQKRGNVRHVGPTTLVQSSKILRSLQSKAERTVNFWRNLTNFWTVVFFAFIIADFVLDNYFDEHGVILTIAAVYGASLAVYSTEKEFKRWSDTHANVHPGEVYIVLWTILIFCIIILDILMDKMYHMPPEVSSSYIVVIGILAITKESKSLYRKKRKHSDAP